MHQEKYKDELPLKTVKRIRDILTDIDLMPIESAWNNSVSNYYSVHLKFDNTNIFTNGKGTSCEQTLASAYAEMMERLQNMTFFRMKLGHSKKSLGFYYAPDELAVNIPELVSSDNTWLDIQRKNIADDQKLIELLNQWKLTFNDDAESDFVTLPYYNLTKKVIAYIPAKIISNTYMTNGMCAGNTIEEAVVQGISEIFERHSNFSIIREKITPPTIPMDYLRYFPKIDGMIKDLKAGSNYEVIVKDCSLGEGYPVIGVILINRDSQTYFVKFGAHPVFEVAVERTLTELLQGKDVKNISEAKEFAHQGKEVMGYNNLAGIFSNGSGHYPAELFGKEYSYEFKPFNDCTKMTNKELLTYAIKIIESKGYEIFIRDVSFLGFPSYHIVVPGLSEVVKFEDQGTLQYFIKHNKIKNYLRHIQEASDRNLDEIVEFMGKDNPIPVFKMLDLPIQGSIPWIYSNINFFITAEYYRRGIFDKAYKIINDYLNSFKLNLYNSRQMLYFRCLKDFIRFRADNLAEKDIVNTLTTFYAPEIVKDIVKKYSNHEQIFKVNGEIDCWKCDDCSLKSNCSYNITEGIYMILKNSYTNNVINQQNLKTLI